MQTTRKTKLRAHKMGFKVKNIIRGESLSIDKRLNSPERCNHLKFVPS